MFDYRSSSTFNYFKSLNPQRRELITALQGTLDTDETELEVLFGVKGDNLTQAIEINRNILKAPLISALDRYSPGVMYQAMDFPGLPTGAQRRLLEEGIIFSGLFGVLRPDDLIPNYKLRMDATLPGVGKVSKYWRNAMSDVVNEALTGRFVWNFLSGIHQDAWTDEHTYDAMVQVRFVRKKGGDLTPVTHGVKPLRGKLVNYIVRETVENLEPLLEWKHPDGYVLDEKLSTWDEETKTHDLVMVRKG